MKYIIFIISTVISVSAYAQQFELSSASSFSVDGTSTLLDWRVTAREYTGSSSIKTKKSAKSLLKKGSITAIHLVIPVSGMISEKGSTMDNKMYRALKMEEFPEMTYTLTNANAFDIIDSKPVPIGTTGVLNIAGNKQTIACELTATFENDVLKLSGNIPLKLSDFEVERPSAMFGQIETHDDITVNFLLEFTQVN